MITIYSRGHHPVESVDCTAVLDQGVVSFACKMGTKAIIAGAVPGVFVSKTKIIICGIVLVVLLILVIILGALFGTTRSKLSGISFTYVD